MSLDRQRSIRRNLSETIRYTAQENGAEVAGMEQGNILRPTRNRKVALTIQMTLIDEFPLRRESIVNLLRRHVSKSVLAVSSVDELSVQWSSGTNGSQCTIFSVGGQSMQQSDVAGALRRLAHLGEAAGHRGLIVLSDREDLEEVRAAFRLGARGFIPTCLDPGLVIAAIRLVLAGGKFVPAAMLMRSHREKESLDGCVAGPQHFETEASYQWPTRQLAVLRLLGEGKTNKHIAMALEMEETTVKVHVRHIMRKLGLTNRTQVALYVRRVGSTAEMAGKMPANAMGGGIATVRAM